ncbi:hypothetical protein [Flavicella sp.]|uniref:hypothetical protein n=1 Tax=Flavicella sp. TaxID=2957742 RepID=UPI003016A787
MKKYLFLLSLAFVLNSCNDDDYQVQNLIPYIIVSEEINLNLSESQDLSIPSEYVVYSNWGHRGIIVYNTGSGDQSGGQYLAFDLACPHIEVSSCSSGMDYSNFPELTNSCAEDGIYYRFDLGYSMTYSKDSDGNSEQIEEPYYLRQYNVVINEDEDTLIISNY